MSWSSASCDSECLDMRFLFVYEDFAVQARNLIAELVVADVEVIVARKREDQPNDAERELLEQHRGAEAAACQLKGKYRKNVAQYVTFTVEPKKFRFEDQLLRAWLVGAGGGGGESNKPPSESFTDAAKSSPTLLLHDDALVVADQLDETRWAFAGTSADLLQRLAARDPGLEPPRSWKAVHGVEFAPNGRVSYGYTIDVGGEHSSKTEWHLKAGDKTSAERAARIYFMSRMVGSTQLVLVSYVGPHPRDGSYQADFGRFELDQSTGKLTRR